MATVTRYLWIAVLALSLAALALGIVFIAESQSVKAQVTDYLRAEKVTLGIDSNAASHGDVVDSVKEAQVAQDTLREHRHNIAQTYSELLAGGRFDPTNTTQLTWAQAMNMENALGIARVSYGASDLALGTGVFMLVTGVAFAGTGLALRKKLS